MSMRPRLTRRTMIQSAAATGVIGFAKIGHCSPPRIEILERRIISKSPGYYCGWPTLSRRSNGELLVVCSGGRESHVCPFGRVELIRSKDNGRTWTWPRTLLDGPIDDRDAGITETSRGSLLVTTFTSLAYEDYTLKKVIDKQPGTPGAWPEDRLARWLSVHNRIGEDQRKKELGQWMIRSTDGGITWSSRYASIVNSPHGPVPVSGGRLLYAGKELWTGQKRVGVCQSVDDGQTWDWLSQIPTREGDDSSKYHELHMVEAPSGKLIVHLRNHNSKHAGETLQCESTDGGKSWSTPHAIGVWGLPSFLTRLRDGRLLMSYGYRRKPFGNQARLSADEGDSWSDPITISDDGAGGDLGYPSTVELSDGSLVSVWYELMKGTSAAVLRMAHWRLV